MVCNLLLTGIKFCSLYDNQITDISELAAALTSNSTLEMLQWMLDDVFAFYYFGAVFLTRDLFFCSCSFFFLFSLGENPIADVFAFSVTLSVNTKLDTLVYVLFCLDWFPTRCSQRRPFHRLNHNQIVDISALAAALRTNKTLNYLKYAGFSDGV